MASGRGRAQAVEVDVVEPVSVKTVYDAGDVLADRYEIIRALGKGGMGMVYLVRDSETGQELALKTLLPQYVAHGRAMHRFVREVTAVRRLNHPSIVKIHDAQHIGPLMFYTMDYIDGKSLRQWLRERRQLSLGSTVRVLALVASALDHAHQFTIHRDLSPENIMVSADGSVRLLDFGLAKLNDSQAAFTRIGISLGKQQYNSPEQLASAAEVDHRSDLYSLGIMFFEMLSGKFPKRGRRLADLRPDLPPECDAFVDRATATKPDDRFATARELREALLAVYERSLPTQNEESEAPPDAEQALPEENLEELNPSTSPRRGIIARLLGWNPMKLFRTS